MMAHGGGAPDQILRPYYKPIKWESSEIETFIKSVWDSGEYRGVIAANNAKTRSGIQGIDIGGVSGMKSLQDPKTKDPIVDLNAIARTKGQVGKMSIEDVILAIGDVKGDSKKEKFFSPNRVVSRVTHSDLKKLLKDLTWVSRCNLISRSNS